MIVVRLLGYAAQWTDFDHVCVPVHTHVARQE
jgi:hypothetical protein